MPEFNGDTKVIIAVLGEKLDALSEDVHEFIADQQRLDDRVRNLEVGQAELKTTMNIRVGLGSAIAAAIGALAGYLKP